MLDWENTDNIMCWARTSLHCGRECKLKCPFWKTVGQSFAKVTTHLLDDAAVTFLGMYLRQMKTYVRTKTCSPKFIAALNWNNPVLASVGEGVNQLWHIIMAGYYSAINRNYCHAQDLHTSPDILLSEHQVNLKVYSLYGSTYRKVPKWPMVVMEQTSVCQGLGLLSGTLWWLRGTHSREFIYNDGTALYPDSGDGYINRRMGWNFTQLPSKRRKGAWKADEI